MVWFHFGGLSESSLSLGAGPTANLDRSYDDLD